MILKTYEQFISTSISNKKSYIGQCDYLRRLSNINEEKWQEMMLYKKIISHTDFIKNIDTSKFLDRGENMKDYIKSALLEDDETKTYISHWGDKECMFLQTCGFEFIFV